VAAIFAHFESIQQIMNDIAELTLIFNEVFQPIEIAPGTVFDERAPQIDKFFGRWGRSHAGQPLAHHERQRVFDRSIGALGDLIEFAAMKPLVEHRCEILRHAIHSPRANCLDACLLDRFKYRARLLADRLQSAMHGDIVASKAQGD
jgi:hypothetical protein